jgi:hypothetical protein
MNPTPETEAEDARRRRIERLERTWQIAVAIRAGLPEDMTSDHGWLYEDETGLPGDRRDGGRGRVNYRRRSCLSREPHSTIFSR